MSDVALMEILAPAGSIEAVKAAVLSGADAVYFGASAFNARRNAKNISDEDIFEVVKYCHIRGVRAYLALNTLVCDDEIKDALSLVKICCEAGVDALIVQDLGLIELIKKSAPNMSLHASTQMSVHNLSGVRHLFECGFKRIVLSREVSKTELKRIADFANANGIELEIFVQGALCMSVSGQCLFSAMLGGRSGNRGLCAGTCRLPFKVDNGNGFDLSLKDLNLYNHFSEFKDLKIASLKIEGRMKRPEYIAMAVDCAVAARDNASDLSFKIERLQKIFSRSGFTDGYYTEKIGADMFGIRSEQDIENSKEIMNSAHEIYRREYPHVAVNMKFTAHKNEECKLILSDGLAQVEVKGSTAQTASNKPIDYDFLREKLSKCGSTPYYLKDFSADIDDGLFINSSEINNLKSSALNELSNIRSKITPKAFSDVDLSLFNEKSDRITKYIGSFFTTSQIPDTDFFDYYILPMTSSIDDIKALINNGKRVIISTPSYITNEDFIVKRLKEFKSIGVTIAEADNIGAIPLIIDAGLEILGGAGLNIFNSYAVLSDVVKNLSMVSLSRELTVNQIAKMRIIKPTVVSVYGRLQLMILKNCPRKAHNSCKNCDGKIVDRMGIESKLICENGVTKLFSDRPIFMADRMNEISCDYARLNFTDENVDEVKRIIDAYKTKCKPIGIFNRGLFYKGVL